MSGQWVLVIIVASSFLATVNAVWEMGDVYDGWMIPDTLPTTSVPIAKDVALCGILCSRNSNCTGVYFNLIERNCRHFNVDVFEFWVGSSDDRIVFFAPMGVVLITDGPAFAYTFQDAANICAQNRGRLITTAEMTSLWSGGYQACSCAWVAEAVNYLPDQDGCGNGISLHDCAIPLGHAFCVLN